VAAVRLKAHLGVTRVIDGIGFEAYCSHIQIRNIKIWRLAWEAVEASYIPEFR
jgi:hypothetical protein